MAAGGPTSAPPVRVPEFSTLPSFLQRCLRHLAKEAKDLEDDALSVHSELAEAVIERERQKEFERGDTQPSPGFLVDLYLRYRKLVRDGGEIPFPEMGDVVSDTGSQAAGRAVPRSLLGPEKTPEGDLDELRDLRKALLAYREMAPTAVANLLARIDGTDPNNLSALAELKLRAFRMIAILESRRRSLPAPSTRVTRTPPADPPVLPPEGGKKRLGRMLKEAREGRRLLQREVAAEVGVPVNTVIRWETGEQMPDLVHMIKLVRSLRDHLDSARLYEDWNPEIVEHPSYDRERGVYRVDLPSAGIPEDLFEEPLAQILKNILSRRGWGPADLARVAGIPLFKVVAILGGSLYGPDWETGKALAGVSGEAASLFYLRVRKEIPYFLPLVDASLGEAILSPREVKFDEGRFLTSLVSPPSGRGSALREILQGRQESFQTSARRLRISGRLLGYYLRGAAIPSLRALYTMCQNDEEVMKKRAAIYLDGHSGMNELKMVQPDGKTLLVHLPPGCRYEALRATSFGSALVSLKGRRTWPEFAESLGWSKAFLFRLIHNRILFISLDFILKLSEVTGENLHFLVLIAHPELFDFFNVVDQNGQPIRPENHGEPFDYEFRFAGRLGGARPAIPYSP